MESNGQWTQRYKQIRKVAEMRYSGISYVACFSYGAEWADRNPAWISVKDELPIGLGRVLFVLDNDYVYIGEYNDEAESNKFGMPSAFLRLGQQVTHWMELPSRPKRQ
jgi:hypothetical protein